MSIRAFRTGFQTTDTGADVITLYSDGACTLNQFTTMKRNGAAYQVTAGKTLYIGKLILSANGANAGAQFVYGDNAVANSASAPTNSVTISAPILNATANVAVAYDVSFIIPATKYMTYIACVASGPFLTMFGIEI